MRGPDFDLLVVGAGPAGTAAALAALETAPDARVALLDRADVVHDKTCGDGLTPAAVTALTELGVATVLDGYLPVRALRLTSRHGRHVSVELPAPAYVVPRRILDARLVEAAQTRGAQLIGHRVAELATVGDRVVIDGRWSARMVVGADGVDSVVRRGLALPPQPTAHLGVAVRGYATVDPGSGRLEIRFPPDVAEPAYGWCFTGGDGRANVGVGTFDATTQPRRRGLESMLRHLFPTVQVAPDTLQGQRLPLGSYRPSAGVGRVLLAGDAASLVDPLTGDGVQHALVSGMLAGRIAMLQPHSAVATYRTELRRRIGRRLQLASLLARAARRPVLLETVLALASRAPSVAGLVTDLALGRADGRVDPFDGPAALAVRTGATYRPDPPCR